ncbi:MULTISPECIES: hypothetical protein [unclassified Curtobacterium]|uniref:hypothetical protein n=1 Tax=unclassified Curtobacterium TaxID=257496 RepID=UPI0027872973|nr:hypothetical protein [Curtobacterium sp. 260]MDP9737181.1 hypothetical protein [Curtobacterium sp. 260]
MHPILKPSPGRRAPGNGFRVFVLLAAAAPGIAGRGVQFLALAWFATLVRPEQYGAFAVLQTLVVGAASVVGSTVGITANTAAAERGVRGPRLFAVVGAMVRLRAGVLIVNACASFLVVLVGFVVLTRPATPGELVPAVVAGALGGAVPVAEVLVGVLAGSGRPGVAAALDALRGVGGAATAVLVGVLSDGGAAAAGLVVPDVVIAVVVLVGATRRPRTPVGLHPRAREGAAVGIAANVLGQVAVWVVIAAVGSVGGPVAMGVYGVAMRFASVITVAPVYLGKVVVRHFVEGTDAPGRWTPRSFVVVVGVLCAVGSVVSLLVLALGFPELVDRYPGVVPVTVAVLLVTSVRAVLICVGQVCVARRAWRTWFFADLVACGVTTASVAVSVALGAGLSTVVLVSGLGHVAGIAVRLAGLRGLGALPARGSVVAR